MPSFTVDAELGASAPRLWLALKDSPTLFPKIAPHFITSIEHIEGTDGQVGAVRLLKFGSVAPEGAYVKEKLAFIDHATFTVTTEEVEGGHLAVGFTKWVITTKFTPISDTSSKWEGTVDYEGGADASETIAQTKEGLVKLFKGLAAYIQDSGAYA